MSVLSDRLDRPCYVDKIYVTYIGWWIFTTATRSVTARAVRITARAVRITAPAVRITARAVRITARAVRITAPTI